MATDLYEPFIARATRLYESAEEREEWWYTYSAYLAHLGVVEYTQAVHMSDGVSLEYTHRESVKLWLAMTWEARQAARARIEEQCAIALLGRTRDYIRLHKVRPEREEAFWIDSTIR